MTTKRERARPLSAEERREAIIAATLPLLVEHGGTVTTRQIAEAAGIAEGTIFRVFADKRSLFVAAAEATMNPVHGREDLADALATETDLERRVIVVVEQLVTRMERSMQVMMALRSVLMAEGRPEDHETSRKPGPPAFVLDANRQLLENLTDLLFAPHAHELRIAPDRAAFVLRSLVFGAWHPGMPHGEAGLTPAAVADVLLAGVRSGPTSTTKDR